MGYQASDDNGETVGIEFELVEADIYFAKLAHFPLDFNLDLFEHLSKSLSTCTYGLPVGIPTRSCSSNSAR